MARLQFKVLVRVDKLPENEGEAQELCKIIEASLADPLHDTDCRAVEVICLQPTVI